MSGPQPSYTDIQFLFLSFHSSSFLINIPLTVTLIPVSLIKSFMVMALFGLFSHELRNPCLVTALMLQERALDFLRLSHQDGEIERGVTNLAVCLCVFWLDAVQLMHFIQNHVFFTVCSNLYVITSMLLVVSNFGTHLFQVTWLRTTAVL